MLINEIAKKYNISVRTLRYYEELGLIHSSRNESNIRIFDNTQLQILEQIVVLKMLNFSLKDIKTILTSDQNEFLRKILYDKLSILEKDTYELLYKQQLLRSLLNTYAQEDFSKKNIREFVLEQIYLKSEDERMIKMLVNTQNIVIEIGTDLIPLASDTSENALIPSIKKLRTEIQENYSIEIDLIRLRDNIDLPPNQYRILQDNVVILERTICDSNFSTQVDQIITHLKSILI